MIKDRQVKMVKDGQAKMVNDMDKQRWSMTWTSKEGQRNGEGKMVKDGQVKMGHLSLNMIDTRETPTTSMSKRFAEGCQNKKNNSNNEIRKSSSCSSVIQTWRPHISSLLKSTIGEHFQHDLESEHCCEEVVKVTQDPAKWFWFDNLLK